MRSPVAVEEAHRELSDAGIPYLDAETGSGNTEDLTSPDLDEMGGIAEPDNHEETGAPSTSVDSSGEQAGVAPGGKPGNQHPDPSTLFAPGVRIHHQDMGTGTVRDVVSRGNTKLLTILFDGKSQATPNVTLNLHRMRIVEDADDDNDS